MASEDEERDREYEEFLRFRDGKPKTGRNPKGAGRPTKLEREYREFREWKQLKNAGFTAGSLSEIIRGLSGDGDGRGEAGDSGQSPRLVSRILSLFQKNKAAEKAIKDLKLDKLDEGIANTYKHLAPYILPKILLPIGILAGGVVWYWAETWTKTDSFTQEEYDRLTDNEKDRYHIWKIPVDPEVVGQIIFGDRVLDYSDRIVDPDRVIAYTGTKYILNPRILHALEREWKHFISDIKKFMENF